MKISVDQEMMRAKSCERDGRTDEAIGIYRAVLRAYPGNRRARAALAKLESRPGGSTRGAPSQRDVQELAALYEQGDYSQAAERAQALARAFPASAALWNILGVARLALRDLTGAETALRNAVKFAPDSPEPVSNLGNALKSLGELDEAIVCYRRALEIRPDHTVALNNLGNALHNKNRLEEAEACYRRALEIDPGYANARTNLGNVLKDQGRIAAAIEAYEAAIAHRPDDAESYRILSEIRTWRPDDPLLAAMLELHDRGTLDDAGAAHLGFALANAFEDLGDPARAFDYLRDGNARRRRALGYDFAQDTQEFARIRAATEAMEPVRLTEPAASVTPVLILGMPRSGTTLVEQILASHSRIAGGGELPFLGNAFTDRVREGRPIGPDYLAGVRARYLERLAALAGGASHVTDKLPHNFRWIGYIVAAFPEAAILHVTRDPPAVCWSNYRQYFSSDQLGYSCDLGDTVAYYRLYRDLMAFWEDRHPGRITHLDYEALTEDPETEARNLLARLGLPWEDACLAFHRNPRSVKTASQQQVRREIYRGSSEAWRKYEPWIGDAFDGL